MPSLPTKPVNETANIQGIKTMREKLVSHIGMNFRNNFADLFAFCLLGSDGKGVAFVDIYDGVPERFVSTIPLTPSKDAIIRLAMIHYRKCRNNSNGIG